MCSLFRSLFLHNCSSAINGGKLVDKRWPVAAWAVLAVGVMTVMALAYVRMWVYWQNYAGLRHMQLKNEMEMAAVVSDEARQ
jgi:hypothetical protein